MTQMNLSVKQKETQRQRTDWWLPRGMGVGGGMEWEFGISKCKLLLYIEWINNKVLHRELCSISGENP